MSEKPRIEVLYFKGCPNHAPAVEHVRQALSAEGIQASIAEIEVKDAAMASDLHFLGSPTIRVNRLDVEPSARGAQTFGFGCRTYLEDGRRSGLPSQQTIRAALLEAASAA